MLTNRVGSEVGQVSQTQIDMLLSNDIQILKSDSENEGYDARRAMCVFRGIDIYRYI
jgi:hypothetical protein